MQSRNPVLQFPLTPGLEELLRVAPLLADLREGPDEIRELLGQNIKLVDSRVPTFAFVFSHLLYHCSYLPICLNYYFRIFQFCRCLPCFRLLREPLGRSAGGK